MTAPYDSAADELAAIIEQIADGALSPEAAAPLIAAQLAAVAPTQFLQYSKILQVQGRIEGMFITEGAPNDVLGAVGSTALDLTNRVFYGPKTEEGWGAGIDLFNGAVNQNQLLVEDYGAVADSTAIDNTAAINAAEAAAALVDGTVKYRDGVTYYYKGTLVAARDRLSWSGRNTRLIYNGASQTRDHFVIGDGVTAYRDAIITGIEFGSITTMTAGTAVRARLLCRSTLDIEIQGQELNETLGNTLWNGLWLDGFDNVTVEGEAFTAQNDVIRVNGAAAGPKAELFLSGVRKAFDGQCGLRIGGDAGGVYLGTSTWAQNLNNVVIDQTLRPVANREIMIENAILDFPLTGGNNLVIDDAGFVQVQIGAAWLGSAPNHNLWIKNCGGNVAMGGGYRVYNAGVDGIRIDDADAVVLLGSGQIHGNGPASGTAWGVNATVASNRVTIDGAQIFGNGNTGSRNVNPANPPLVRSFSNYAEFTDVAAGKVLAPEQFVDANFGSYLSGGNPFTAYDANDYETYDRSANRWSRFIAGGQVMALSLLGLAIGPGNDALLTRGGAGIIDQRNGVNAQAHWITNTWTDGSNFERGVVGWNGNNFDVNTAQAGTGTSRNLRLYTTGAGELQLGVNSNISWKIGSGGHWLANADATYDIGASLANRPRDLHLSRHVTAGGSLIAGSSSSFAFSARAGFLSPADGVLAMSNNAGTDFGRLIGGPSASASYPSWKRSGAGWQARVGDDSALTTVEASNLFSTSLFLGSGGVLQWASDLMLYRGAANRLSQYNGTAAQRRDWFNTRTDASNGEWAGVDWQTTVNVARFGTFKNGTGSTRVLQFVVGNTDVFQINGNGHQAWSTDNAFDIGVSGAKPRTGLFGTSLGIGVNSAPSPLTVQSASVAAPIATFNDGAGYALAYFGTAVDNPLGRGYLVLQNPGTDGNGAGVQFRSNNGANSAVFSLDGSGNVVFRVQGNTTNSVLVFDNFGTNSNNAIWFRTGGANTRLIIANNGNISVNLATATLGWTGRTAMSSSADGNLLLTNAAGASFGLLQGGGTTNAFPAWKRSGAGWDARLADDSGLTFIGASSLILNGQATLTADGSHIFAQRNGANAQTFRLYNSWTDPSNFERASMSWGSNVFSIRTGGLGTGAQRAFVVDGSTFTVATGGTDRWQWDASGHQLPQADNVYNLGSPTQRVSQAFFVNPFVYANTPAFTIVEKDEAADGKVWNLRVNGGVMTWGVENDSYASPTNWMSVTRSGLTVSNITFAAAAITLSAPVTTTSVKTTPVLFSALPAAATAGAGTRAYITDATVAFTSANIGTIAAGGGANKSPVTSDGANWLIG